MSESSPAGEWAGWHVYGQGQEDRVRAFAAALRAAEAGQGGDEALRYTRRRSVLTYTGEHSYGKPLFTDVGQGKVALRVDESSSALVAGERYYHVPRGEFEGLWLKSAVDAVIGKPEPATV